VHSLAVGYCLERLWPSVVAIDGSGVRQLAFCLWLLDRRASALGNGPIDRRPDIYLLGCGAALNQLPFCSAGSGCSHNSLVGCQFFVRSLRAQDALWTHLRRYRGGVRLDDMDGVLDDDRFSWRSLERGKFPMIGVQL